jgi:hypothetical protein
MSLFILTARIRDNVVEIIATRNERQKDAHAPSDIKRSSQE